MFFEQCHKRFSACRDRVRSRLIIIAASKKITFPGSEDNFLRRAQSLSAHLANLLHFSEPTLAGAMKGFRALASDVLREQITSADCAHARILDNLGLFYGFAEKVSKNSLKLLFATNITTPISKGTIDIYQNNHFFLFFWTSGIWVMHD